MLHGGFQVQRLFKEQVMPALKNVSSHKSEGGGENTGKSGHGKGKGQDFVERTYFKPQCKAK